MEWLLPVVKGYGAPGVLLAVLLWSMRRRVQEVSDAADREKASNLSAFEAFKRLVNASIRKMWKKSDRASKRISRVSDRVEELDRRVSILEDRDEREKRRKS